MTSDDVAVNPSTGVSHVFTRVYSVRHGIKPLLALLLLSAILGAQPFAYVTNQNSGSVSIIDTATDMIVGTIPVAPQPHDIAVSAVRGRAYILHTPPTGPGSVSVIDISTRSVISTIPVGVSPSSLVVSADGRRVYVVISDRFSPMGSLVIIDTANNLVVTTIPVAYSPWKIAISPNGRKLYITHINGSNVVSVVDTSSLTVTTIDFQNVGPYGVAFHPNGERAYVTLATNVLAILNTSTNEVIKTIQLSPLEHTEVIVDPNGRFVYALDFRVSTPGFQSVIDVIDVANNTTVRTLPAGTAAGALTTSPDGSRIYVVNPGGFQQAGTVLVVDPKTGNTVETITVGQAASAISILTEAPLHTTSYYVRTTNATTLNRMGRDLATAQLALGTSQNHIVALLFGQPTYSGGRYEATCFSGAAVPTTQIAALVEAFASGYYNALNSATDPHVRIVIATSNHGTKVTFNHGRAWAQMVNDVALWVINHGYSGQIDIAGGSDIEPDWNRPAVTRPWVEGYASVVPQRFLYNVGNAGGCPQSGTTAVPGTCNGGWTQEDIWYVSYGAAPSLPLPEIYTRSGSMAAQWANLSLYSNLAHQQSMTIAGTLTQFGQCEQSGGCRGTDNTPAQGWQQLHDALKANPVLEQVLPWSTDIKSSGR